MRPIALALALVAGIAMVQAAKFTVDGINYDTSGGGTGGVVVAKYTITSTKVDGVTVKDTAFYAGDITIPEKVTDPGTGTEYTVTGVASAAFRDCKQLTHVYLPATCVKFNNNCFRGCENLENYPVPATATNLGQHMIQGCVKITEAFLPGGVTATLANGEFEGSGIKKLTIMASSTPAKFSLDVFGASSDLYPPIEELVLERDVDASNFAYNKQPFHYMPSLKTLVIGGEVTTLDASMFVGCSKLETVTFEEGNKVTAIGASAFSSCAALRSAQVPAGVTTLNESLFYNCPNLSAVQIDGVVTGIGANAFNNAQSLTEFTIPATVNTIGVGAFFKSGLTGEVVIPGEVRSIGANAFAEANAITALSLPASLATIGNAAFAPIAGLAQITLDEGNAAFKLENGVLYNAAGKRLIVTAHEGELGETLESDVVESIDNYGLSYSPFTGVSLPGVTTIGNYAFYKSNVKEFTIPGTVQNLGVNVFTQSALETLTIGEGVREIPNKLCYNCASLATVNIPSSVTNIMQDAFADCPVLEEMEIGTSVNYMEKGSVPATIKRLRVLNVTTPVLGPGVFTPDQSDVECKVATASVDAFKAAAQWQYLNIVGDETISGEGAALGCPSGLYFATKDGRLMYKDTEGEIIDTEFRTGEHSFNLGSYKNRIYVAVAGHNWRYEDLAAQANGGDGELFYVNKSNDYFYRVTVLNNVGYKAFEDPFTMTLIPEDNKIYISDRNVGIHEMDLDATGLYGSQPFFMENNYLPYYNDQITYGAIGAGMMMRKQDIIDKEGTTLNNVYWVAKKFNGFGIFRFDRSRLYTDGTGANHPDKQLPVLLLNHQMTSFYIDEENGYLYFFLQNDQTRLEGKAVPGVYRIALSTLLAKQDEATVDDAVLIDDSPVLLEGSGDEVTGVTQFVGDGEYVYWSYIAPTSTTAATIPGSVAFDESNPLHKTGIKRVVAKVEDPAATPVVDYVVEGIAAYGLALSTYVPDEPDPQEPGDVNGDGIVSGADVTALYNVLLDNAEVAGNADVNNDGVVSGADVTALYNLLLN